MNTLVNAASVGTTWEEETLEEGSSAQVSSVSDNLTSIVQPK